VTPSTSRPATSTSAAPTTPASSTPASTTASTTTNTTANTTVVKQPLVVLNNTDTTGLADTAKTRFEAGGWTVTGTGNLVNDIISTCAYYDPNVAGAQAAAAALQAQFPAIKRTAAKFDGLPAGPIIVVLTTDYS
jgi:LytR cell envelope-related transcriptional attenuator